ncbi:MAG: helix-turn-helix domain-containing protein [Gaiellaceae bacterium]
MQPEPAGGSPASAPGEPSLLQVTPPGSDRLLTASEVADMLSVPERWVREHTRGGLIPHVRLGRYVRYRREAILGWIDEQERVGARWRNHHPRAA